MSLTKEQKVQIVDYILEGDMEKAILESTSLGKDYPKGNIKRDDIYNYINSIKERELKFLESEK
jgi:hypothetical protein